MHEPTSASRVAMMVRSWSYSVAGAATKEGQKAKRKIEPLVLGIDEPLDEPFLRVELGEPTATHVRRAKNDETLVVEQDPPPVERGIVRRRAPVALGLDDPVELGYALGPSPPLLLRQCHLPRHRVLLCLLTAEGLVVRPVFSLALSAAVVHGLASTAPLHSGRGAAHSAHPLLLIEVVRAERHGRRCEATGRITSRV